jgi:lantibiotic leader peptide-processing serine protease
MHHRTRTLPLVTLVFLATACVDDNRLTAPPVDEAVMMTGATSAIALTEQEQPTKHLFVFNGRAPADFEVQVTLMGGTVTLNHHLGIAVVTGLDAADAPGLGASVRATYVEEIQQLELIEPAGVSHFPEEITAELQGEATGVSSAENPAGAILFARQWNLRQVNAPAAWASGRLGSPDVTVAILDTGIDYMLPDLAGRVDLSRSASFEQREDPYTELYFPGRHLSTDLHYHGTNVATQVASNAWAFAGVTSGTTLMSVKVCSVLGGCRGVIEGILYAVDNGADVINMSLGGWFRKSAFPGQVSAYNRIMNYARQQGVTIVVSAGNDANDLDRQNNIAIKDAAGNIIDRVHVPSFFATYCDATHVICVAATRTDDQSSSYTNYGRSAIDVSAPGGGSGDWVYSLCPQTSLLFNCASGYFALGVAGTSQAAPHVAGLAALAVQDVGRNPAQVRAYIRNSADPIGGGNSPYHGKGRINVGAAVGAN